MLICFINKTCNVNDNMMLIKSRKTGLNVYSTSVLCLSLVVMVTGTGTLVDPPSRGVMWKEGFKTNINYNYMQQNCGGVKQNELGPRQCGVCGDQADPIDGVRNHELGNKYGKGTIVRYFKEGIKEIDVIVELQAFELGFFEFRLCPANNKPATQECLNQNLLPIKEGYFAGIPMRYYPNKAGDFRLTIAIPPNMTCERCVLQWRYRTANSWGVDPVSKEEGLGKGPQEEFYNCADIRIGGEVPKGLAISTRLNATTFGINQTAFTTTGSSGTAFTDFASSVKSGGWFGSGSPGSTYNVTDGSFTTSITFSGDQTGNFGAGSLNAASGGIQAGNTGFSDQKVIDVAGANLINAQKSNMEVAKDITDTSGQSMNIVDSSATEVVSMPSGFGSQDQATFGIQNSEIVSLQDSAFTAVDRQASTVTGVQNTINIVGSANTGFQDPTIVSLQDTNAAQGFSVSGGTDSAVRAFQDTTNIGTQGTTMVDVQDPTIISLPDSSNTDTIDSSIRGFQDVTSIGTQGTAMLDTQDPTFVSLRGSSFVRDSSMTGDIGSSAPGFQENANIGNQGTTIIDINVQDPTLIDPQVPAMIHVKDPSVVGIADRTVTNTNVIGSQDQLMVDIQGTEPVSFQDTTFPSNQQASAGPDSAFVDPAITVFQDPSVISIQESGSIQDPSVVGFRDSSVLEAQDSSMVGKTDIASIIAAQGPAVINSQVSFTTGVNNAVASGIQEPTFSIDPAIVANQDPISIMDSTGTQDTTMFVSQGSSGVQSNANLGTVDSMMVGAAEAPILTGLQDTISVVNTGGVQGGSLVTNVPDSVNVVDASVAGAKDSTVFSETNIMGGQVLDNIGARESIGIQDTSLAGVQGTVVPSTLVPTASLEIAVPFPTPSTGITNKVVDINSISADTGSSVIYKDGERVSTTVIGTGNQEIINTGLIEAVPVNNDANLLAGGGEAFRDSAAVSETAVNPIVKSTGLVSAGEALEAKTFIGRSEFPTEHSISQKAIMNFMQERGATGEVIGTAFTPRANVDQSLTVRAIGSASDASVTSVNQDVSPTVVGIKSIGDQSLTFNTFDSVPDASISTNMVKQGISPTAVEINTIDSAGSTFNEPTFTVISETSASKPSGSSNIIASSVAGTTGMINVDALAPAVPEPIFTNSDATASIDSGIRTETVQNTPIAGDISSVNAVANKMFVSGKTFETDPFEHIPAQSLAVIPLEQEAKRIETNVISAAQTMSTKDLTIQPNPTMTSGGNSGVNVDQIKPLDGLGLSTVLGDKTAPVALGVGASTGETNMIETTNIRTSDSTSGFSGNRMVDLSDVQVIGSVDTNIQTLRSGETLKAGIDIQPDNVKSRNVTPDVSIVDMVGSGATSVNENNRTVSLVSTQIERPRFRFVRDPVTGMMTRVLLGADGSVAGNRRGQLTGGTRTDMLRRVLTRDGTLSPEYFLAGSPGRRGSFSGVAGGSTGARRQTNFVSQVFGDVSGRRPIFPLGFGGVGTPEVFFGPGMAGARARSMAGSRTGMGFTAGSTTGDRRTVGAPTVTGSRISTNAVRNTDTSASSGVRTAGDSTRGDAGRARTALFIRPTGETRLFTTTGTGPSPSASTGMRRPGFGASPGMTAMTAMTGRTPMVQPASGIPGTPRIPGIPGFPPTGGFPGGGFTAGGFGTPGFGGFGLGTAMDMNRFEPGGDFFTGGFRPFGFGGAGPFSPTMPLGGMF